MNALLKLRTSANPLQKQKTIDTPSTPNKTPI